MRKINNTYSPLLSLLWFLLITKGLRSLVLCLYQLHKTKPIEATAHVEVDFVHKVHLIADFFAHSISMQRELIFESLIETAFQHNVWGFLELKHFQ